jgi:gas vesicle protein
LVREKKRLEKINDDLSKKLMTAMKDQDAQRKSALAKEKKRNEHQVAYLTNEIN